MESDGGTFMGWIFVDYMYAVLGSVPNSDTIIFHFFSHFTDEANPSRAHPLFMATHFNQNDKQKDKGQQFDNCYRSQRYNRMEVEKHVMIQESRNEIAYENPIVVRVCEAKTFEYYRGLCWGRWIGPCPMDVSIDVSRVSSFGQNLILDYFGGLGTKLLQVYRLLREPEEALGVYYRVSVSMLREMLDLGIVDRNDQWTFHTAISGGLYMDKSIRGGKIFLMKSV